MYISSSHVTDQMGRWLYSRPTASAWEISLGAASERKGNDSIWRDTRYLFECFFFLFFVNLEPRAE